MSIFSAEDYETDRLMKELAESKQREAELLGYMKAINESIVEVESHGFLAVKVKRLRERVKTLEDALKPFGAGGVTESLKREDCSIMHERIVDWHGVSDYVNAHKALAAKEPK